MQWGTKPVIIVGEGCRYSAPERLLELGVPILTSWQSLDLIDNDHHFYFGRPGIYGQRCANKVLYNADFVLSIGCRLSIWQTGYTGVFSPNARICMVDIDEAEIEAQRKLNPAVEGILLNAGAFISSIEKNKPFCRPWINQCNHWRLTYPWIESPAHDDTPSFVNSYRFMERINTMLKPDAVITADVGGAMCAAFQVLRLKPPQRLISSGGLGEMGCSLPYAIGASFARNKGDVLCLVGDGGMMLNLQELQTVMHHWLPVKIIVFANDGYGMIKVTQKASGYSRVATDTTSGVSCPDFRRVASAFGMDACQIRSWEDFERIMPWFMQTDGPALCEVFLDPEQQFVPKLTYTLVDGKQQYPTFDNLSPRLE